MELTLLGTGCPKVDYKRFGPSNLIKSKKEYLLMNYKPIIIILGEPYSVFIEIFFKSYKNFIQKKYKIPIILVGSYKLLKSQMKFFGYKYAINILKEEEIGSVKDNKVINSRLSELSKTQSFEELYT